MASAKIHTFYGKILFRENEEGKIVLEDGVTREELAEALAFAISEIRDGEKKREMRRGFNQGLYDLAQ